MPEPSNAALPAPVASHSQATIVNDVREEFRMILARSRLERGCGVISNRFPWQSRMAVLELLKHAQECNEEVRILSGTGTARFYSAQVVEQMEACLKKGIPIRMVVWDERPPEGLAVEALRARHPENFDIVYTGTRVAGDKIGHFLLVGKTAYRLEAVHGYLGESEFTDISPETKAKICFNDPVTGETLDGTFNLVWKILSASRPTKPTPSAAPASPSRVVS